jgi:hypothetical protein
MDRHGNFDDRDKGPASAQPLDTILREEGPGTSVLQGVEDMALSFRKRSRTVRCVMLCDQEKSAYDTFIVT